MSAVQPWAVVALVGAGAALVVPRLVLRVFARGRVVHDSATLAHHDAVVVLGARVFPDGSPSWMLADRVAAGVDLLRTGAVDRVLLTGDGQRSGYDEVATMAALARRLGAGPEHLLEDRRGLSTSASCHNAGAAFRLVDTVFVTQRFHADRTAWLAAAHGLAAQVLALPDRRRYGRRVTLPLEAREVAAAWKAVVEGAAARLTRRRSAHRPRPHGLPR